MSSVVISGDTSGAITLAAPSVAGTNTITLPASTGTVMVNGPAFSAYLSSNQTVSTGTWTKVTQDTKEFDTNSNFASNRFTPTVAGYYQFNGAILFNANNSITRSIISLYKNGSTFKQGSYSYVTNAVGPQSGTVSSVIYCNGSTDYVELYGYVEGVGTLSFLNSSSNTYFNGSMVRSA